MRDSRKETEECETINKFLVRFRKFHRGVLEKHMKQNILSHIYYYSAIFPKKKKPSVTSAGYQYSKLNNAVSSFLPKIIPHHVGAHCTYILFYGFYSFQGTILEVSDSDLKYSLAAVYLFVYK